MKDVSAFMNGSKYRGEMFDVREKERKEEKVRGIYSKL